MKQGCVINHDAHDQASEMPIMLMIKQGVQGRVHLPGARPARVRLNDHFPIIFSAAYQASLFHSFLPLFFTCLVPGPPPGCHV